MRRTSLSSMPRPHLHTFYELYYLLEGERDYFINGKVHVAQQGGSSQTNYIQTNFRDTLTLDKLAQQYFISPAYLSCIFLRLTGFHISEYIRVIRIREAQKLLRTSRQKVHLIAEMVGFEHVSHFNSTFKKVTGVSHYDIPNRYMLTGPLSGAGFPEAAHSANKI
jgi:AraC-like DNA-binding protein